MVITPCGVVKPLYTVKVFHDQRYRVVKFKRSVFDDSSFQVDHKPDPEKEPNTEKLENSLSRSRSRIIELGLCNPWTYFFTGTLSGEKVDRFDMKGFQKKLSQWMRDRKKAYQSDLKYLLVPEFHENGAVHVHGFLSGIPISCLTSFDDLGKIQPIPVRLLRHGFSRWDDFDKKFGFCSLAPIRDRDAAAFYISKYVSKNLCQRASELNAHLFWASQGLASARPLGDCYTHSDYLDQFLTHKYDFCEVGWVRPSNCPGLDWTFDTPEGLDFHFDSSFSPDVSFESVPEEDEQAFFSELAEFEQLTFFSA